MRIRTEQMQAFEEAAKRQFDEEMVAHSKNFAPPLCEVIGDEQLRLALRSAMSRADSYGFTNRGPVRLFIEMMFLCGSDFDTDPQYPALGQILRSEDDQMDRAEQIHKGFIDYLEKVSGPEASNVHKALRELLTFTRTPLTISRDDVVGGLLREMNRIFPQRVKYVGEAALTTLIRQGQAEARSYGFTTVREEVLIVVLKFAFGHGCTDDPLYPWISRTLKDERLADPAAKSARLEKRAITWLEHVVARNERGPNA